MRKSLLFAAAFVFALLAVTPAQAQPPAVTITGPTSVVIPCGCDTIGWTANPSGGQPPYIVYAWTLNGSAAGTNSPNLSQQYCNSSNEPIFTFANVAVTVTDSNGRDASDTHFTSIELEGCG